MTQGKTAVIKTGVGDPRVVGEIANMALSVTRNVVFDLGPDWDQIVNMQLCINPVGPSTGLSNVAAFSQDLPTDADNTRLLALSFASGAGSSTIASMTTAAGPQTFWVRPMGRYLRINVTNADGAAALGAASSLALATYR